MQSTRPIVPVSVIVPTYNRQSTLRRCLSSVLDQTRWPDEIIVVNDGSPDVSQTELDTLVHAFPRARALHRAHRGVSAARNSGLCAARNRIVAFLDSDDTWERSHLETALSSLDSQSSSGLVLGRYSIEDEANALTPMQVEQKDRRQQAWVDAGTPYGQETYVIPASVASELLFSERAGFHTSSLVIDFNRLSRFFFFDEQLSLCEDIDYLIRITRHTPVCFLNTVQTKYFFHGNNTVAPTALRAAEMYPRLLNELRFLEKKVSLADNQRQREFAAGRVADLCCRVAENRWDSGDSREAYHWFKRSFLSSPNWTAFKNSVAFRCIPEPLLRRLKK